jgi:hypothetical protein
MKKTLIFKVIVLSVVTVLLAACSKKDDILHPQPMPEPQPDIRLLPIMLKAAITVGDVLYDSIPATFTIITWDLNNVAHQKDTMLNAGAQLFYLSKDALRYSLKMHKWGVTYEKVLERADVTEGVSPHKIKLLGNLLFFSGAGVTGYQN